jgi:predicted DCC family thiol-disulfide oxidoreductase YuxK
VFEPAEHSLSPAKLPEAATMPGSSMKEMNAPPFPPLLVFDGDCAFCHRAVRFILAHERRRDLLFVRRATARGVALREQYGLQRVESLLWIEDGRAAIEWEAVWRAASYVGGGYEHLAAAANWLPRPVLNVAYRMVAQLRKRLARPPRDCLLLTPAQQKRFLE